MINNEWFFSIHTYVFFYSIYNAQTKSKIAHIHKFFPYPYTTDALIQLNFFFKFENIFGLFFGRITFVFYFVLRKLHIRITD